jgi:hypothetical protein
MLCRPNERDKGTMMIKSFRKIVGVKEEYLGCLIYDMPPRFKYVIIKRRTHIHKIEIQSERKYTKMNNLIIPMRY